MYRLIVVVRDSRSIYSTSFTNVKPGRWFVDLPEPEKVPELDVPSDGIVCFVLGARFNHPLGKLAPGVKDIGSMMAKMWDEMERDRFKYGFMGRTRTMVEVADTEAITMTWLTYWTDVDKLQKFATSVSHRLGQTAYGTSRYNHVGIMHETYKAPKGSWESVYLNMRPFGLGSARLPVKTGKDDQKRGDLLREVTLASQQTLRQRMRGNVVNAP
ncbi:hypothetical protein GRF29_77g1987749 [Pseudopithomyces chartarum]|uniref:Uncharacterized protein n=1 Tax=Pseudopithomyces chartarum TaxID=1892770 RepID=A0AAN6M039_9PLEO|nr:hypothetical protein GRF29_77g1987749 [Pseudopithomyces chartarum]